MFSLGTRNVTIFATPECECLTCKLLRANSVPDMKLFEDRDLDVPPPMYAISPAELQRKS